ncbi:hypothetical protein AVEN_21516-1 [Araneus ventricosus]|uniref:Uncharacterized protein n=1 Tax=Araneus ventricosus TaxID=182803 RepID=A0A4Y2PIC5_ARAVE|nr:hypothetical protein AVEN_21516-1 [Araneus ventricosus]
MANRFSFAILCGICLLAQGLAFQLEDSLHHFKCFNESLCNDGPLHQKLPTCQNILTPEDSQEKIIYIRDNFFPANFDDGSGLVNAFCNTADDKKPEAYQNIVSGAIANVKRKRDDPEQKGRYNRLYSMLECLFGQLCNSSM